MLLSSLWSIDSENTISTLPRGLALIVIPLFFIGMKKFTLFQREALFKYYSLILFLLVIYWLIRALVRFVLTTDTNVFFYHELVSYKVNAIYASAIFFIGFFLFSHPKTKNKVPLYSTNTHWNGAGTFIV
jgi:amino acid permease